MPIIKSAIKKLRQDKKREEANDLIRQNLKLAIRNAKKAKSSKSVALAIQSVDKATKKNIIHKNKASRIKSTLTKLAKPTSIKSKTAVTSEKTQQKVAHKKTPLKKSIKAKKIN